MLCKIIINHIETQPRYFSNLVELQSFIHHFEASAADVETMMVYIEHDDGSHILIHNKTEILIR